MSKLVELKSPFEQWPGSIWIPETINAYDFNLWWEKFTELEDAIEDGTERRHSTFTTWESRFHLIKKCTLKLGEESDGTPYEVEKSGLKLPSRRIAEWFITEVNPYLEAEMNLKN